MYPLDNNKRNLKNSPTKKYFNEKYFLVFEQKRRLENDLLYLIVMHSLQYIAAH